MEGVASLRLCQDIGFLLVGVHAVDAYGACEHLFAKPVKLHIKSDLRSGPWSEMIRSVCPYVHQYFHTECAKFLAEHPCTGYREVNFVNRLTTTMR
jgi:hypothetical protein